MIGAARQLCEVSGGKPVLVGEGPGVKVRNGVIVGELCVGDGKFSVGDRVAEGVCVAVHGMVATGVPAGCAQAGRTSVIKPRIKKTFIDLI